MSSPTFNLRPGITNVNQWQPVERKRAVPDRIRKQVLARDDNTCMSCGHRAIKWMHIHHLMEEDDDGLSNLTTLCPACHAVMHFGRSMSFGIVEVWKASIPQVEIVRRTREGVRTGQVLGEINATFDLKKGRFAPNSVRWADDLLFGMGPEPRAELPEPLCVVFVDFTRWQVHDGQ